jgi:hypothetical protein
VEAYTQDLWEALGPKTWPAYLVTDAKKFSIRDWSARADLTKSPKRGEKLPRTTAFTLLVVMGADPKPTPMERWDWLPVVMVVVPGGSVGTAVWEQVFRSLPGTPAGLTSDGDSATFRAARKCWPGIELNMCLYHAKARFKSSACPKRASTPRTDDEAAHAERLWAAFDICSKGPVEWDAFVAEAMWWGYAPTRNWLNKRYAGIPLKDIVRAQVRRFYPKGVDSNSVAESQLRWVSGKWENRAGSFRNAERTNRLLKLMILEGRRSFDERRYAEVIDEAFKERGGRPPTNLRVICDNYTTAGPSLR